MIVISSFFGDFQLSGIYYDLQFLNDNEYEVICEVFYKNTVKQFSVSTDAWNVYNSYCELINADVSFLRIQEYLDNHFAQFFIKDVALWCSDVDNS